MNREQIKTLEDMASHLKTQCERLRVRERSLANLQKPGQATFYVGNMGLKYIGPDGEVLSGLNEIYGAAVRFHEVNITRLKAEIEATAYKLGRVGR